MASKKIVLVGGGGHCVSVIDVIELHGGFKIAGIVDVKANLGHRVLGYKVIGTDDDLPELLRSKVSCLVAIGHVGKLNRRIAAFEALQRLGAIMAVVQSPLAYVSRHADLGKGSIVMHHALVNANAAIGANVIINTKALIEHDVRIGRHCHVATGAVINGGCVIGDNVFVGSNSVIKEGLTIAPGTVIGAGSVVVRSITRPGTYVGNPCRKVG